MTTHDELRKEAVMYARMIRNNHHIKYFFAGSADDAAELKAWQESTKENEIMARYILSLYDETPVDREQITEALRDLIGNTARIRQAGQLRILKAVVGA